MKLRNKKTGRICELECITLFEPEWPDSGQSFDELYSIAELNENWEDYKPAEPLIKDEKIRKAVRAWADADGADEKIYLTIDENGSRFANKYGGYIEFAFQIDMDERLYTIVELCGEGEE